MHHALGKLCGIGFRLFMEKSGLKKQLQDTARTQAAKLRLAWVGRPKRGVEGQSANLWWLDGRAEIEGGNYTKALEYLNEAVEKDPNTIVYRVDRGIAKFKLGDPLGAKEDYDAARAIDPITFANLEIQQNRIPGL